MRIAIVILSLFCISQVQAQRITGRITDDREQPIAGAAVVLLTADSIYVSAAISDADGTFGLESRPETYRLIVQHLLYRTKEITAKSEDAGIIRLITPWTKS